MLAEDIMTPDPVYVEETTLLGDALVALVEGDIRHLPVVRDGELIGILTDRDLRGMGLAQVEDMAGFDRLQRRMRRPVADLMRGSPVTVETKTSLADVVDILVEEKLGALPVVEPGTAHLVGIVSVLDVLRASRDVFDADG